MRPVGRDIGVHSRSIRNWCEEEESDREEMSIVLGFQRRKWYWGMVIWFSLVRADYGYDNSKLFKKSNDVVANETVPSGKCCTWWHFLLMVLGAAALVGLIVACYFYRHRWQRWCRREKTVKRASMGNIRNTGSIRNGQWPMGRPPRQYANSARSQPTTAYDLTVSPPPPVEVTTCRTPAHAIY